MIDKKSKAEQAGEIVGTLIFVLGVGSVVLFGPEVLWWWG